MQDMPENQHNRLTERGRLSARLVQGKKEAMPPGLHPLALNEKSDALLYVPTSYQPDRPIPLILMLHGAGGTIRNGLAPFFDLVKGQELLLLAVGSHERTWDLLIGGYGPDVAYIDLALKLVLSRYTIDPQHIAIEGFSDGASYALSLGLGNGNLFTHIIAFSPGFMAPASRTDSPRIYISHGKHDPILPVDRCSRRIVPQLRREGYKVHYHEFLDFHSVPSKIAQEALNWFINTNHDNGTQT